MRISIFKIIISALILPLFASCFTGIEGTPKISAKQLKKTPVTNKAEMSFTDSIASEPFELWQPGKRFKVTDSRIAIVFTSTSAPADSLMGHEIVYRDYQEVPSLTGDSLFELRFTDPRGAMNYYMRVNSLLRVEVPFTVEMKLVEEADRLLRGRTLYVVTPMWYDESGNRTVAGGRRHIAVQVDSVVAGNSVFPVRVIFTPSDEPKSYSFYMTVGSRNNATRNFHTLFSYENPRTRYPDITDAVWQKIIRSQVQPEMTRDECRLALGAPNIIRQLPTTAGMVEQWVYDDGRYLIFEDGFLSRYRN